MTRRSRFKELQGQFSLIGLKNYFISKQGLKINFSISFRILLLFVGFVFGNLIGQFDSLISKQYFLLVIIILFESITWFKFFGQRLYTVDLSEIEYRFFERSQDDSARGLKDSERRNLQQSLTVFSANLDTLKRGFLLGVCVEAFKVGS
jgi:hypothetical protein